MSIDNPMLRTAVRDSLRELGFDQVALANSFDSVQEAIGLGEHDLLIFGEAVEGRATLPLIRRLRTGELGPHPFALVLLLLQPGAATEMIRDAINSGPDDVLVMPFATKEFHARITRMAESRKPFVVTYHYTGPDRRKQDRIDASPTPVLAAPNPIVMKARGEDYASAVRKATDQYRGRMGDAGNRMILSLLHEGATLCRVSPPDLTRIERVAVDMVDVGLKLSGRTIGQIDDRVQGIVRDFVNAMGDLRNAKHAQRERVAALGRLFQGCLDALAPGMAQR